MTRMVREAAKSEIIWFDLPIGLKARSAFLVSERAGCPVMNLPLQTRASERHFTNTGQQRLKGRYREEPKPFVNGVELEVPGSHQPSGTMAGVEFRAFVERLSIAVTACLPMEVRQPVVFRHAGRRWPGH